MDVLHPQPGTENGRKNEHHLMDAIHRVAEASDDYSRRVARSGVVASAVGIPASPGCKLPDPGQADGSLGPRLASRRNRGSARFCGKSYKTTRYPFFQILDTCSVFA